MDLGGVLVMRTGTPPWALFKFALVDEVEVQHGS
jgi:hypothetical protein